MTLRIGGNIRDSASKKYFFCILLSLSQIFPRSSLWLSLLEDDGAVDDLDGSVVRDLRCRRVFVTLGSRTTGRFWNAVWELSNITENARRRLSRSGTLSSANVTRSTIQSFYHTYRRGRQSWTSSVLVRWKCSFHASALPDFCHPWPSWKSRNNFLSVLTFSPTGWRVTFLMRGVWKKKKLPLSNYLYKLTGMIQNLLLMCRVTCRGGVQSQCWQSLRWKLERHI